MNIIGLKKEEVRNKKVISTKTFCEVIDLELDQEFDIILLGLNDINHHNLLIDKVDTANDCIICISFPTNLIINVNIGSTVKQFYHDFLVAHSFSYSSNNIDFNIYPISLNFKIINKKVHLCITYAFCEASLTNNTNQNEFFLKPKNEASVDKISTFSDFSYIDISKEFI